MERTKILLISKLLEVKRKASVDNYNFPLQAHGGGSFQEIINECDLQISKLKEE